MEVNEKLKQYLEEHGISQAFVAEKTGIPYKSLNDMINGRVKVSAENLGRITKCLNVSADIFLD